MNPKTLAMERLIEVVAKLRSPHGGCPWDLQQTHSSLIPYVIEEAYEVVDAIRSQDPKAIAEELGDLLLQVVLQAQVASDLGNFTIAEVSQGITEKLIRRHPHVFADVEVSDLAEIHQNWEQIKAQEKGEYDLKTKLNRYARTLPPMMATQKIVAKTNIASAYEPRDVEPIYQQFQAALVNNHDRQVQQEQLGDLLFDLIALADQYNLDAFAALQGANLRFIDGLESPEND